MSWRTYLRLIIEAADRDGATDCENESEIRSPTHPEPCQLWSNKVLKSQVIHVVVDTLRLSAIQGDERAEIVAFILEVFRRTVKDDLSVIEEHDAVETFDACEVVRDDD